MRKGYLGVYPTGVSAVLISLQHYVFVKDTSGAIRLGASFLICLFLICLVRRSVACMTYGWEKGCSCCFPTVLIGTVTFTTFLVQGQDAFSELPSIPAK